MLLDEPFSNLDVDLRERLAHEVRGSNVVAQTPLGDLTDLAECPCPAATPAANATCCCAPTTSCTTTKPPCRRKISALRMPGPAFTPF